MMLARMMFLAALFLFASCKSKTTENTEQSRVKEQASLCKHAPILAPLIDPAKLDTIQGKRAATPRLRKACYWLETALRDDKDPTKVIQRAQSITGYQNEARAQAVLESLLRNRTILERLGCLSESGMDKLRRGKAPTITKGRYVGELATVDHIIPRSVCPELDNRLYNLEFMPDTLNKRKSDKVGDRQKQLAEKWRRSGLLSEDSYRRVTP